MIASLNSCSTTCKSFMLLSLFSYNFLACMIPHLSSPCQSPLYFAFPAVFAGIAHARRKRYYYAESIPKARRYWRTGCSRRRHDEGAGRDCHHGAPPRQDDGGGLQEVRAAQQEAQVDGAARHPRRGQHGQHARHGHDDARNVRKDARNGRGRADEVREVARWARPARSRRSSAA